MCALKMVSQHRRGEVSGMIGCRMFQIEMRYYSYGVEEEQTQEQHDVERYTNKARLFSQNSRQSVFFMSLLSRAQK